MVDGTSAQKLAYKWHALMHQQWSRLLGDWLLCMSWALAAALQDGSSECRLQKTLPLW